MLANLIHTPIPIVCDANATVSFHSYVSLPKGNLINKPTDSGHGRRRARVASISTEILLQVSPRVAWWLPAG